MSLWFRFSRGGVGNAVPDRVNFFRAQMLRSVGGNAWRCVLSASLSLSLSLLHTAQHSTQHTAMERVISLAAQHGAQPADLDSFP